MRFRYFLFFFLIAVYAFHTADARKHISLKEYGVDTVLNTKDLHRAAFHRMDSMVRHHPLMAKRKTVSAITHKQILTDNTSDFYLLLFLFLLLGLIRISDPRYFQSLIRSFISLNFSTRQLKEQIQSAKMSNFLMNIFFALSAGAYLYYLVKSSTISTTEQITSPLWLLALIGGVIVIYLVKYAMIRLTGWAFRVEALTDHYIYNVFLANKIIAILLLPFIVLLAFGDRQWFGVVTIISVVIIGVLLVNRYIRSWQVFGSFFQYSRFHFFTYLCASELLPLAVLMKLIARGML